MSATATSSCSSRSDPIPPSASSWPAAAPGCTTSPTAWARCEETLEALSAAGVRLIDEHPRTGIRGSQVAFLHPSSTGGVLTEIVQPVH